MSRLNIYARKKSGGVKLHGNFRLMPPSLSLDRTGLHRPRLQLSKLLFKDKPFAY
jgi:hypothetical protein